MWSVNSFDDAGGEYSEGDDEGDPEEHEVYFHPTRVDAPIFVGQGCTASACYLPLQLEFYNQSPVLPPLGSSSTTTASPQSSSTFEVCRQGSRSASTQQQYQFSALVKMMVQHQQYI